MRSLVKDRMVNDVSLKDTSDAYRHQAPVAPKSALRLPDNGNLNSAIPVVGAVMTAPRNQLRRRMSFQSKSCKGGIA